MDLQLQQEQSPSLEDCLKLLKGERDEQRLAGLLLVTKFCEGNDLASLKRVYDAIGAQFLVRLLRTGLGKGITSSSGNDNREAYLQLSVTVLAVFCRVPEIASSDEMVSKIPYILEIMSSESASHVREECYEFLYLVSAACDEGIKTFFSTGGLKVLAFQMSTLSDGSHATELAIKLLRLLLSKLSRDSIDNNCQLELSMVVGTVARTFSALHNAVKFEALHLLSGIFSSDYSALLHGPLRVIPDKSWSNYMRIGIVAILQNRVAPADKLHALILAESMVSIMGEEWLIGQVKLSNVEDPIPADRCLLLVLESSRVEVAVLLNELAYLKYESSGSSSTAETILLKQREVAIAFSLVEKIIKLISRVNENEENLIDETVFLKVIKALNETMIVVLEYLQDAKEHGHKKGNDLLASVRVVGSYLAETPIACKEKVRELLNYILTVEGEDESRPFYSACFLLPMLCQITMTVEGCKVLVGSGGYKAVVECLIELIGPGRQNVEDNGCIFLACDTIMNLLLKREQVQFSADISTFVDLLKAFAYWGGNTNDPSITMMAASICALIFDFTSEDALMNHLNFEPSSLGNLSQLIAKSLAAWGQGISDAAEVESDLLEIITAGYFRWADRYPQVRKAVGR